MADQWEPQDGFQVDALDARYVVDELFGGGNRGGGKSDWLLMDFAADVVEHGKAWKGVLFRRTFSQFRELIDRSKELFLTMWPNSDFREGPPARWRFAGGAQLEFFHMAMDSDAEKHLGLSYAWIGYDELPHWPSGGPYKRMKATNRTGTKGVPLRIRSTGNPGGAGLAWIKDYFKIPDDPAHPGGEIIKVKDPDTKTVRTRMFLRSTLWENKKLLEANPGYPGTVREACEGNEQLEQAWLYGNFNVFFGKFFPLFDSKIHCKDYGEMFDRGVLPDDWKLYGSLDYGENDYTSFGLWGFGEHEGRNVSYRIGEWYGKGLWLSEYAGRIRDMVENHPVTRGRKPERVFADTSIFYTRAEAGGNPMDRMTSDVFRREAGLRLEMANKNRLAGWRFLKDLLAYRKNGDGDMVRHPHMYYSPECLNFERCMTNAVFDGDEDNPKEDMNTRQEDHPCDDTRYYAMGAVAPNRFAHPVRGQVMTMGDIRKRIMNPGLNPRRAYYVPVVEDMIVDVDQHLQELEDA